MGGARIMTKSLKKILAIVLVAIMALALYTPVIAEGPEADGQEETQSVESGEPGEPGETEEGGETGEPGEPVETGERGEGGDGEESGEPGEGGDGEESGEPGEGGDGEETEAPVDVLTYQTIGTIASDGAEISISGLLPQGAYVTAVPVSVELEDGIVLAAYDIKIFDGEGNEWQPNDSV